MCPGGAPVAGGVRRWRPEACTCGPDVPCSGAKCRSAPQMILNKAAREGWQAGTTGAVFAVGEGAFAKLLQMR